MVVFMIGPVDVKRDMPPNRKGVEDIIAEISLLGGSGRFVLALVR